ncbi:interaptin-like [Haliotis rubra]|uniref:interaptin-like n=1 Tax=Haliotis rubra TaxID=36100 RepID=UPI001EE551E7|nr:interaptin-like [Haliotis rubra]
MFWSRKMPEPDPLEDSDTDSVEEVQITRYLNQGLLQGLQQAKACNDVKLGVKRQTGYYHLKDRKHAVITPKVVAYDGKHWDLTVSNRLHRATPRLTAYAIEREIAREQLQQVKSEESRQQAASRVLQGLHAEFQDRITQSLVLEQEILERMKNNLAVLKDDAHCELMRKHNIKHFDEEAEIERERQVAMVEIFNGCMKSPNMSRSVENMLGGIAESNHRKSIVQQDLTEAFARYNEEEVEADSEYKDAMMEMMDESLNTLRQMFNKNNTKRLEEDERRQRLVDLKKQSKDPNFRRQRKEFDGVMNDLHNAFDNLKQQEMTASSEFETLMSDRKECVLQELRRGYAARWVDKISAREKARRIQEEENLLLQKDPYRDQLLKVVSRVQRQMILQKFAGRWINLAGARKIEEEIDDLEGIENDRDKKLKATRIRARRPSCVVSGIGD